MKINNIFKLIMVSSAVLLAPLFKTGGSTALAQVANTWERKADFGGVGRFGSYSFSIGNKGYIGGGNSGNVFDADFWEYDPATNAWSQKANGGGGGREFATGFAIGSKGYMATGHDGSTFKNDCWEYDPASNTWIAKANLPGAVRYGAVAFNIGTKGYLGTGYSYGNTNDFYEFDPVANTWTAKANVPGGTRYNAMGFGIGTKGYIGGGNIGGNRGNDFYEYDPAGNTWTAKANIGPLGLADGFGVSLNNKGYVAGTDGSTYNFYEYDPTVNIWTQKERIPTTNYYPLAFSIGTKLYVGLGLDVSGNGQYITDFYQWSSCGRTLTITPSSAVVCSSGAVTLTASGATTYTWSNGMANGGTVTPTVTTHYTVTGTSTGTCPVTNSAVVTILASSPAANQTLTPATSTFACNGSINIKLGTEAGVNYYLRNDANNTVLAGPIKGTGSTLIIPTGNFSTTTTFNINATKASGGLNFDGIDDNIKAAVGDAFNFADDFTIETWMRSPFAVNPGMQGIISRPGALGYMLGLTANGFANFTMYNISLADTTSINDGKWHHLAATRSLGTISLYVDGVLVSSGSEASAISADKPLEIGSYDGLNNFKGQLDEIKIYNTGLTQAQVVTSMTGCATGQETGMLVYYNFEDGAGSPGAYNLAGGNNNATLYNMNTTLAWSDGVENCMTCATTQLATKPVITIVPINNQSVTAVSPGCSSGGGTGTITIPGSDINVNYFLRDNSNTIVSGPVAGTGNALSFTEFISSTKIYNVYAKSQSSYLYFNGIYGHVSSPTVGIPSGNAPYTIEALIKPDPANTDGAVLTWGNRSNTGDATGFRLNGTNQLVHYWWNNDLTVFAGNLADGAWHHVAATYDGVTRAVYVDGVLAGSDTPGTHNAVVSHDFMLGCAFVNGSGMQQEIYKGGMDEVRVWAVSRTQAEIITNMNSSLSGSETGLSVYYKFTDGTSSNTVKDFAGGDNTGSLANMNTATDWQYYSSPCTLQMSNTATVTINLQPFISVNSTTVCSGKSVTLIPSGAASYTITGGTFTVSPLATTRYSVTATSSAGCVSLNTAISNVTVAASPTISVTSPSICPGNSVAIVATGANTYTITGNTLTVTPLATTLYSVTGKNSNGCISASAQISTVTVLATPTLAVNSGSICANNSFAIVPSGANAYTITGGNFLVSPLTTTSFSVTGTGTNNCISASPAIATVTVFATPTLAVNSATVCSGNSVAIVPSGANSYTITGGNYVVTPLTTTSYSVTGTNAAGCVSSNPAVASVSVNVTPTISVNSGSVCSTNSFAIVASGANTYTISGGSFLVSPLTTASFSVTGTGTNNCVSASPAIATVTVFAAPTLAVNSATVCSGSSVAIVPSGAMTYTITGNNFIVTPLTTTSYSVTGTSTAGCVSSAPVVASVSVNVTPTISVNSGSICSNNSFAIVPSGANTYTISGGNFSVSPLTTTSFSVTGTGANGCISAPAAVSTVTVFATPTLAVNSGSVCSGNSITIVPSGANSYTITGGNYIVTPFTTTSYSVTGTSTAGCVSFNTVISTVTVFATPTLAVNSATVCSGNPVTIVASGAATYSITGNSFTVTPLTTASYSVTGTSAAGCISASAAVSQVSVNITPTLTVNSGSICYNNSFTITPSGATTYTITGNNFTVAPLTSTSYSVIGTGANGCITSVPAISQVSVDATPTIAVTNTTVCSGIPAVISPSGATTYTITGGTFTVSPSVSTSYSVTGTSAAGCAAANAAVVSVAVDITPTVSVAGAAICSGNSFLLVPFGADSYTISGGSFSVSPSTTTSYSVTGTSTAGCVSAEAIAEVTVNALPAIAISGSTVVCAFSTNSLSASGAITYTWNEGQANATIVITPTVNTSYTVTGTDANGCINTSIAAVIADPCTGIPKNNSSLIFGIYPNPNHGEFVVETAENVEVIVLNSLGQLVYSEKTASAKTTISIDHLANGIYFVKVTSNGNQQVVKLIKE